MINSLRGMNDILPPDSAVFEYFISVCKSVAARYGVTPIAVPLLEETALFKRSVGESSDIVGKEMYRFVDKGENDVCLRPEGTAGVVRAFVQAKLDRAGGRHAWSYFGPMFRYERPQKGRLRQFHQFGVEIFGEPSVLEDANVIFMTAEILDELGVGFVVKINSLGCDECAPSYRAKLVGFLEGVREHLCEDCHRRIETNPLRTLDCKVESCKSHLVNAPKITDHLCSSCDADFERLKGLLSLKNIAFEVDKNLVRGLDYYNKTAFEFVADTGGSQNAIAGGGRYDKLVEFLDGRATPAVGFAIGVERILPLVKMPQTCRVGVYLCTTEEAQTQNIFLLGATLRKQTVTHIGYDAKSVKAHLKAADRSNALFFACRGETEVAEGLVWLKNLETKNEVRVELARLEEFLDKE
jgi:histidyl-tRNA synthetase